MFCERRFVVQSGDKWSLNFVINLYFEGFLVKEEGGRRGSGKALRGESSGYHMLHRKSYELVVLRSLGLAAKTYVLCISSNT